MPLTVLGSTHESLAVSSTAVGLTNGAAAGSASKATYAVGQVLSTNVRHTRGADTPTATSGTQARPNTFIHLTNHDEIVGFKAIAEGSDATIQWTYYTGSPFDGEVKHQESNVFTLDLTGSLP